MLKDFRCRFATVLDRHSHNFNPVPAAATLLDPTVASVLLNSEVCIVYMLNIFSQLIT